MPLCPKCNYRWEVKSRSNSQNSYYWGVVIETLSDELGYTPDEMHEIIKHRFLTQNDIIKGKTGAVYVSHSKSTTSLTTKEFEDLMTRIRQWASMDLGIFIQEPNEPPMEG